MSGPRVQSAPRAGRDPAGAVTWLLRAARLASVVAVPAVAAFVVRELVAGKLGGAMLDLSHAVPGWVLAAMAAEVVSYLLYAAAQRRLLRRHARSLRIRWLASLAVCAQGVSNFVPAGYLAANLLNFRELRRRGLSGPASAWLLLTSSGLYIGVLAFLTVVAGEIAGAHVGSLEDARIGAGLVLAGLPVLGFTARLLLRRGIIHLPRTWRTCSEHPRLSRASGAAATALFAASWLADAGCLVAALFAVGAHPAWDLVPIAYCAGQLVSFLPVTPGGLGLVEGSLTVALMAGGGGASVLAAVLLYRLISYWGTLPFGLLGYLAVRRARLAGSTTVDGYGDPEPPLGDRAPGRNQPLLVLEG